jgi:signal transduction histidine kinase
MTDINDKLTNWYEQRLLVALVAFLYYITGVLSIGLLSAGNIVTIGIFMPEGIALAFVLFFGKKVIPGIFLGQFSLAFLYSHIGFMQAFEISIINSLEALLALYLFQRFSIKTTFESVKDVIGFTLVVALALQPFSAIVSNVVLYFQTDMADEFLYNTFSWWFGNTMGQLLFTPFLLLFFNHIKDINLKEYFLYGFLYAIYFYFFLIILSIKNPFLLVTLSIPLSLYIVSKKGLIYGTFISAIVAVVSSLSIYHQLGAFYLQSSVDNTINYNLFVLAHQAIILSVGILLQERKNYENTLEEKIEYEVLRNKEQQLLMLQQSRLAQMGEMISMIAHQWRQPLNNLALVNQLTIVKYQRGKLDDKAINYFKENSESQIALMSETIDNFRNFFKSQGEQKACVLNDVISTTLELSKPTFVTSNIDVSFKAEGRYEMIGFANALSQVLLNILNNAKDALIENEIKDKKIWIRLYKNENETIYIEIEDNAGGIPANIIDKIFDPYFSTKLEKNGTGLGLYMSRMIIQEQMGSTLKVVNTNNGAKFEICLNPQNKSEKD